MSEEDQQAQLKKKIGEIMRDPTIPQAEKSRRIQHLMSHGLVEEQDRLEKEQAQGALNKTAEDIKADVLGNPSYNDPEKKIFGCKHYARDCRIRAKCCGQVFPCRLCHDEQVQGHKIDRYATEEIVCARCGTLQPVSNACISEECKGKPFARLYCGQCKLWDNSPTKNIFHCPKCKICRVGKGLGIDVEHCDICGCCYNKDFFPNHPCKANKLNEVCPVCHEDLFGSTNAVTFTKCGHPIHGRCLNRLQASLNIQCPVCKKSIMDIDDLEAQMDFIVASNPMPKVFEKTKAEIFCNDCNKKAVVQINFVSHKCPHCRSYNTSKLSVIDMPTEKEIEEYEQSMRKRHILEFIERSISNETEGNEEEEEEEDEGEEDIDEDGYDDFDDDDDDDEEEGKEEDEEGEDKKEDN